MKLIKINFITLTLILTSTVALAENSASPKLTFGDAKRFVVNTNVTEQTIGCRVVDGNIRFENLKSNGEIIQNINLTPSSSGRILTTELEKKSPLTLDKDPAKVGIPLLFRPICKYIYLGRATYYTVLYSQIENDQSSPIYHLNLEILTLDATKKSFQSIRSQEIASFNSSGDVTTPKAFSDDKIERYSIYYSLRWGQDIQDESLKVEINRYSVVNDEQSRFIIKMNPRGDYLINDDWVAN